MEAANACSDMLLEEGLLSRAGKHTIRSMWETSQNPWREYGTARTSTLAAQSYPKGWFWVRVKCDLLSRPKVSSSLLPF